MIVVPCKPYVLTLARVVRWLPRNFTWRRVVLAIFFLRDGTRKAVGWVLLDYRPVDSTPTDGTVLYGYGAIFEGLNCSEDIGSTNVRVDSTVVF